MGNRKRMGWADLVTFPLSDRWWSGGEVVECWLLEEAGAEGRRRRRAEQRQSRRRRRRHKTEAAARAAAVGRVVCVCVCARPGPSIGSGQTDRLAARVLVRPVGRIRPQR